MSPPDHSIYSRGASAGRAPDDFSRASRVARLLSRASTLVEHRGGLGCLGASPLSQLGPSHRAKLLQECGVQDLREYGQVEADADCVLMLFETTTTKPAPYAPARWTSSSARTARGTDERLRYPSIFRDGAQSGSTGTERADR